MPKTPRQPDGVLVDPQPAVPESRGRAPAMGVVTLEPPIGDDALFAVVTKFFDAFSRRAPTGLAEMFVPGDIVPLDTRRSRSEIMQEWEQRNRTTDFSGLRGMEVVRIKQMERFDYTDLSPASSPPRPQDMEPGDVLIRLPVASPIDQKSGNKLFRDVLVMVLRPMDHTLRIAGVGELDTP